MADGPVKFKEATSTVLEFSQRHKLRKGLKLSVNCN